MHLNALNANVITKFVSTFSFNALQMQYHMLQKVLLSIAMISLSWLEKVHVKECGISA